MGAWQVLTPASMVLPLEQMVPWSYLRAER